MRGHDLDAKVAEEAHTLDDAASEVVRVLADPPGERERVDATARRSHGGDGARNAVHIDLECERRRFAHVASDLLAGQSGETGLAERVLELRHRDETLGQEIDERADRPGAGKRVAIGTPSSGVKPIVVSTERPSRTAVTEQPPPRWQTPSGTCTCW